MTQDLCCTSTDRQKSPDAPGARIPITLTSSQMLVSLYQSKHSEAWNSLTPSDRIELNQNVPTPQTSKNTGNHTELVSKLNMSPSGAVNALKRRLSKGAILLKQSPTKLRSKISKRFNSGQLKRTSEISYPTAKFHLGVSSLNTSSQFDSDAQLLQDAEVLDCINSTSSSDPLACMFSKRSLEDLAGCHAMTKTSTNLIGTRAPNIHSPSIFADKIGVLRSGKAVAIASRTAISLPGRLSAPKESIKASPQRQAGHVPRIAFGKYPNYHNARKRCHSVDAKLDTDVLLKTSATFCHDRDSLGSVPLGSPALNDKNASNIAEQTAKVSDSMNGNWFVPSGNENSKATMDRAASNSSVHLYHMRISQHLRSLSNFSGRSARSGSPDEVDLYKRRLSSQLLHRRKSSSGFSSNQVPTSWGEVLKDFKPTTAQNPSDTDEHTDMGNSIQGLNQRLESAVELTSPGLTNFRQLGTLRKLRLQFEVQSDPQRGSNARPSCLQDSLDGPSDYLSEPDVDSSCKQPLQPESVRHNYNETTAVWEKAIRVHQEDEMNLRHGRTSSLGSASRKSSKSARKSMSRIEVGDVKLDDNDCEEKSFPKIEMKRVNTSHSFDLIAMPGRQPALQTHSPVGFEGETLNTRASGEQRLRSISQPPSGNVSVAIGSPCLLVPKPSLGRKLSLSLSIPDISFKDRVASLRARGPRKLSNLRIWSTFPSHNREARNASAGIADNVVVRDFQPLEIQNDLQPSNAAKEANAKHNSMSKLKTRLKVFSGKYLTDIPMILKNRAGAGFRRREHGHRSSISVGGVLEYPELELLPRSEPQLEPAVEPASDYSSIREPLLSSPETKRRARKSSPEPASRLGSSNYESGSAEFSQSPSPRSDRLTSAEWADIYGQCIQSKAKQSIDGAFSRQCLRSEYSEGYITP